MNSQPKPPADRRGALKAAGVIVGITAGVALLPALFLGGANDEMPSTVDSPTSRSESSIPPDSVLATATALHLVEDPTGGYKRSRFGQTWADVDRNGCDQRNDVLRRDLVKRHTKPGTDGCVLIRGVIEDDKHNYAGYHVEYVKGDGEVEIDHTVSLRDAWNAGAHAWDSKTREKFANDFMNLEAVDSGTNSTKADASAADWLPDDDVDACDFVMRQVSVKHRYRLGVTSREKKAMVRVLTSDDCPGDVHEPFTAEEFKVPKPKPIGEPKPKPKPSPERSAVPDEPSEPTVRSGVHPGAFCSPAGARGTTTTGKAMVCKGPGQPRWRAR
jgi:hypothetical protein